MNAREELSAHIVSLPPVKHVHIVYEPFCLESSQEKVVICGALQDTLRRLDFEYDDGFGSQELFGHIWYEDGTWSERSEYDGAEDWRYIVRPEPPYGIQ